MPWSTTKITTTKNLNWRNKSWGIRGAFWRWFSSFLSPPSTLCYNSSTRYPELVRSLFSTSRLFFATILWSLSGIFWRTKFHSICSRSDSFLVFFISSLYVESNTLFIRTYLPLHHNFILFWKPHFQPVFCVPPTKIQ